MADDSIEVKITATDQLSPVLKSAASNVSSAFQGIRTDAATFQAALQAAGGSAQAAGKLIESGWTPVSAAAKIAASESTAAASAVVAAGRSSVSAFSGVKVATGGAIQEYIRLGHEAMTGNFSRIPGSIVVLAERMGGLRSVLSSITPAFGIAAAAATAFAGSLAFIVYRAIEAERELERYQGALNQVGHGYQFKAAQQRVDDLTKALGVTHSAAEAVGQIIDTIPGITAETSTALQRISHEIEATNKNLPAVEAAKEISRALEHGGAGIESLAEKWQLVIDPTTMAVLKVKGLVDQTKQAALLAGILAERYAGVDDKMKAYSGRAYAQFSQGLSGMGATNLDVPLPPVPPNTKDSPLGDKNEKGQMDFQAEAVEKLAEEFKGAAEEADALRRNIGLMKKNLADMGAGSDSTTGAKLEETIEAAQEKLDKINKRTVEEAKRASEETFRSFEASEAGKLEAAKSGSAARIAVLRVEMARAKELGLTDEVGRKQGEIAAQQREGAQQGVAAAKAANEAQFRALQEQTQAAQAGSQDRINAALKELAYAKQAFGEGSAQWKAAESAKTQATNEQTARRQEILAKATNDEIRLMDRTLAESLKHDEAQFKTHQVSAQQLTALQTTSENLIYSGEIALLSKILPLLDKRSTAYQEMADKIGEITATLKAKNQEAQDQETEHLQQQLLKQVEAWRTAMQPITGYVRSAFDTMFEAGQNWHQREVEELERMVGTFAGDVAEMTAKWLAFKALTSMGATNIGAAINPFGEGATGLASLVGGALGLGSGTSQAANTAAIIANTSAIYAELTKSAGGSSAMMLASQGMPSAGAGAGAGAAASGGGMFSSLLNVIKAPFTALESALGLTTVATQAGSVATAAQTAVTAVQSVATGAQVVATTADTAITGPAAVAWAANTAATIVNTTVMGGTSLIPHAEGAWNLASDENAFLHQGEMVIPSGPAAIMRRMAPNASFTSLAAMVQTARQTSPLAGLSLSGGSPLSGLSLSMPAMPQFSMPQGGAFGGGGGEGGGGAPQVHFHINALDGASVQSWLNKNSRQIAQTVQRAARNNSRNLSGGR